MEKRGKFIVIDGGEGSGKGTIVDHLRSIFSEDKVLFTREPGGTPLGEKIRSLLLNESMHTMTELLLFEASRAEHVEQLIAPTLERGIHVLSDRFDTSTYGYQIVARRKGKHEAFFRMVNTEVLAGCAPDLYLFCDIVPEVALARRMEAGEDNRFDREALAFHKEVYRGQREYLADKCHMLIDTSVSIEAMLAEAERVVRNALNL